MNDTALADGLAMMNEIRPPGAFSATRPWRAYRDLVAVVLAELDSRFEAADAAELEEAERKVAELRARISQVAPSRYTVEGDDAPRDPATLTQTERARLKWAETDAGRMGAGRIEMDEGTTAEEFTDELRDLKLQTAEKRKRLRG